MNADIARARRLLRERSGWSARSGTPEARCRSQGYRTLAEHAPDLALEAGHERVEVPLRVHHDLDLAVRHPAHAAGVARHEGDDERLARDAHGVGDREDPLDLPERDFLEHPVASRAGRPSVK